MNIIEKFLYWIPLVAGVLILVTIHAVFFFLVWGTVVAAWHLLEWSLTAILLAGDFFISRIFYKVYLRNPRRSASKS